MSHTTSVQPKASATHPFLQRGALAVLGTMAFLILALSVQLVVLTLAEPVAAETAPGLHQTSNR